jgi:hypothetical protein
METIPILEGVLNAHVILLTKALLRAEERRIQVWIEGRFQHGMKKFLLVAWSHCSLTVPNGGKDSPQL